MALIIRDDTNTPRTITDLVIRDGTNTPRTITQLWVRDSTNTPRLVFSSGAPLSAVVSPENVFDFDNGTGTATAGPSVVTASDGSPPYTYAWSLITYDGSPPPSADSPTSASSTFTQTGIAPGDYLYATFDCLVTDSLGATATVTVTANFYSVSP